MNSINTHIPLSIVPQQKQGSEQSYNRNDMGNRPHHQSRSFESMLGKSDSQDSSNVQRSCCSGKPAIGNLEDNGEDKQSDFDNKYSQILKILQQLIDLIQKLQAKADDKASQPAENSSQTPMPVEPDNGTGAGDPVDLPPPNSKDTPNIPAEEIDFPADPDDSTDTSNKDKLPNVSVNEPPAPPQFEQPIPVEPDNGTGAGSPIDLPPPSTDTPNIPAEEIDFPVDPDNETGINSKGDLPHISVSDPGRFENEPELVEANNLKIDTLFSLDVPEGSAYQPLQGIDSTVGNINTPEYSLTFDLGNYGGINSQFEGRENYQTKEIEVDGKKATLATYFASDSASAERTEHPYTIAIKIPLGEGLAPNSDQSSIFGVNDNSLTLHARLDSADQYSEMEKIFKSIKFGVAASAKPESSAVGALPELSGVGVSSRVQSEGINFNDWFTENHGDINGDKNIDTTDIRLWLKGEKG